MKRTFLSYFSCSFCRYSGWLRPTRKTTKCNECIFLSLQWHMIFSKSISHLKKRRRCENMMTRNAEQKSLPRCSRDQPRGWTAPAAAQPARLHSQLHSYQLQSDQLAAQLAAHFGSTQVENNLTLTIWGASRGRGGSGFETMKRTESGILHGRRLANRVYKNQKALHSTAAAACLVMLLPHFPAPLREMGTSMPKDIASLDPRSRTTDCRDSHGCTAGWFGG